MTSEYFLLSVLVAILIGTCWSLHRRLASVESAVCKAAEALLILHARQVRCERTEDGKLRLSGETWSITYVDAIVEHGTVH